MSARLLLSARLPDLLADDRGLIARFADHKDEAAFAAIVKRYGPMVIGPALSPRKARAVKNLKQNAKSPRKQANKF